MSLRFCVIFTVIVFVLAAYSNVWLWLPLVGVIQALSTGSKLDRPPAAGLLASPVVPLAVAVVAAVALAVSVRGLRREQTRRGPWVALIAASALALGYAALNSMLAVVIAPRFYVLFSDLAK